MRVRVALAIAVVLVLSACDPGDIDLVLDDFGSTDLSASDDPGEQAAGDSVVEILSSREAERNLDRAIAEGDPDAANTASNLQPDDPRYPAYEAALNTGPDNQDAHFDAVGEVAERVTRQDPDIEPMERARVSQELIMNAQRDVLRSNPDIENADRIRASYCLAINQFYPNFYTDAFPQEVSLFLALEADFSLCD